MDYLDLRFTHKPLDLDRREIRLIRLRHDENKMVCCELRHFDLDSPDMPEYHALSYTWGPPLLTYMITINAQPYAVRLNLHDFLTVACERKLGHWLWIDQICIAQMNTEERNHQVKLMGEIYSRAKEGIVWLGRCKENHALIMDLFLNCGAEKRGQFRYHAAWDGGLHGEDVYDAIKPYIWGGVGISRPDVERALSVFCSLDYWSRLWIVQEVKLLRSIRMWWGWFTFPAGSWKMSAPITASKSTVRLYERQWLRIEWLLDKSARPSVLPSIAGKGHLEYICTDTSPRLWQILEHTVGNRCEDPRDVVFGIQSIVHTTARQDVDYRKPVEQVLSEARAILHDEWFHRKIQIPTFSDVLHQDVRLASTMLRTASDWPWIPSSPLLKALRWGFEILDKTKNGQHIMRSLLIYREKFQSAHDIAHRLAEYADMPSHKRADACALQIEQAMRRREPLSELAQATLAQMDRILRSRDGPADGLKPHANVDR